MRIKIQQFLFGANHSWAVVGQNIGRAFLRLGHDVEFISTNGFEEKYCPEDLRPHAKKDASGKYDLQLSYTAPHNWGPYLDPKFGGVRLAIWNYEYNGKKLLSGFSRHYKHTTKVLPSSYFTKEVFLNMGIPEEHMVVVPHGINLEDFESTNKCELKTNAKKKIILNIAQPHRRKAIPLALKSFGKAFNKNDDVCLVAKVFTSNKKGHSFDINWWDLYKTFEREFPKHAEVEIMTSYVPNIADLYNSCDINFSATHAECWWLPGLEAMAAGLVNVTPRYGGQLDFCNDDNSLLISGNTKRAPRTDQYWTFNPHAVHYVIDTKDAAKKLQCAVENHKELTKKFAPSMGATVKEFTWEKAALKILTLCE